MSNELAISACTLAIRQLLEDSGLENVTTLPLDRATESGGVPRVNLFMYHTLPNAAYRNQPMPNRAKSGERSPIPLALNLFYLLTAYGDGNQEDDHQLLGRAMLALHSNPVLDPRLIERATSAELDNRANLHEQLERIKVSYEPLTMDELMKLWGTFHQSPYRISAAYQASVVLLESTTRVPAAFPVFFLGENKRGPEVSTGIGPTLDAIEYVDARENQLPLPSAQIGDVVGLTGSNLPVRDAVVAFYDPRIKPTTEDPEKHLLARVRPLAGSSPSRLLVQLDETDNLVAGRLAVLIEYGVADHTRRTNHLRFYLSPRLTDGDGENDFNAITTFEDGRRHLILNCFPPPGPRREVQLLLSSNEGRQTPPPIAPITPEVDDELSGLVDTALGDTLKFDVETVPPGSYRVRLRVDLVDSLPMRRDGSELQIDQRQVVQI